MHRVTFASDIGCNVAPETMRDQVAHNIRRGLPQAKPHDLQSLIIALVCGGPSLNQTEQELRDAVREGAKIAAVNGSYNWCLDHGLRPSVMVMIDGREFNAKFVERPVQGCRYLLASQCHPRVFDLCQDRDVIIWHACSSGDEELQLLARYYDEEVWPVIGGSTVAIRAILLLRMLGFVSFDIFGLDSCVFADRHHAYQQQENDDDPVFEMWLRPDGREDFDQRFLCTPWMAKQAYDFLALIKHRGDEFQLNVRGPGLIAAILKTAAQIEEQCAI